MTYRLVVREPAEQDLLEAQRWYEEQRRGLGREFRAEIDALLRRLTRSPSIYPVVYRDVRRAVVPRFPYLIFFGLTADEVVVLACFHGSRDPRRMQERLG